MAEKEIKARVQLARKSAADWTALNPVLKYGEKILIDTVAGDLREKVGDGVKTYSQLPFADEQNSKLVSAARVDSVEEDLLKSYDKTASRGEQLITNGTGLLGDNTNFSSWTFDGTTTNNSPGSFTMPAGHRGNLFTDEYIPISTQKEYTLAFDIKSLNGAGTLYAMLDFYDADENRIIAGNHIYIAGTTTKLARDLVAGDTVVYVEDLSKWVTNKTYHVWLAFWNQTNSFGYTYPAETYTRNRWQMKHSNNLPTSDALDYVNNCITLNTAYTGATIPAGTELSQGGDGSSYKYLVVNKVVPTEWTMFSGKIKGVDYSGTNISTMFPPGVAYAKVGYLWNYNNSAGEQLWITNVTVQDTTQISALNADIIAAQTTANAAQTAANTAQTSATNAHSKIDNLEIGGRNHIYLSGLHTGGVSSASVLNSTNDITINGISQWDTSVLLFDGLLSPGEYTFNWSRKLQDSTILKAVSLASDRQVDSTWAYNSHYDNNYGLPYVKWTATAPYTFTLPYEQKIAFVLSNPNNASPTQIITGLKVEKGSKATDWTPAPEDMAEAKDVEALETRVLSAEANITQNAEQIELRATKTDIAQVRTDIANGTLVAQAAEHASSATDAEYANNALYDYDNNEIHTTYLKKEDAASTYETKEDANGTRETVKEALGAVEDLTARVQQCEVGFDGYTVPVLGEKCDPTGGVWSTTGSGEYTPTLHIIKQVAGQEDEPIDEISITSDNKSCVLSGHASAINVERSSYPYVRDMKVSSGATTIYKTAPSYSGTVTIDIPVSGYSDVWNPLIDAKCTNVETSANNISIRVAKGGVVPPNNIDNAYGANFEESWGGTLKFIVAFVNDERDEVTCTFDIDYYNWTDKGWTGLCTVQLTVPANTSSS